LDDLSIDDRGVLKSPITTVLESICAFKSFIVCLMKLGALMYGTYRLIIVISFWCTSPFISMKCPSLLSLKSTLSEINIATLACFQGLWLVNLLPVFHPKPVFVSVNEMDLCKQQIVFWFWGFFFFFI
jgi:hypothetical protein